MAELYVKPGNQEKGWNDPPQFSYGLQSQGSSSKRPPLTKRVAAPLEGSPQVPPPQSFVSPTPPKLPPASSTPPLGPTSAEAVKQSSSLADGKCGIAVEDVLGPLNHILDGCREVVRKQVCDDISRRLTTLQQMWENGKLSPSVRKRTNILVQELQAQNWDAADEIHRSLMVDHVNEVSQWMVGVKRLIAEARNVPSEASVPHKEETGKENPGEAQ